MASNQPQFGSTQGAGPSDSSSFSTPAAQRTMNPSGNGSGLSIPSRATSPSKQPEAKSATAVKNDRPIDIRAEEEAARRFNVGRVTGNNRYGAGSRGKRTDLFGPELKMKLERMAKDHQVTFDDESLAYLSMAAESRLRDILTSSISAQQHRTTTSYLHPPPTAIASGSGSKKEKAMWAVSVNSDPNALLEVLNKQAKDAERDFRTSRMTRLAREHEIERIRERQGGGEPSQESNNKTSPDDDSIPTSANAPAGATSPDRPNSPLPKADVNATPTFGGVSAKKTNRGKKTPTFSPDVQIKMSNATAMRSTGMGKKYSWMNNAPNISSPLSGRKKGKKGTQEEDVEEGGELGEGDAEGSKKRKKSGLSHEVGEESGKRQKKRRMPTLPSRRMVPVTTPGPPGLGGNEKMVSDDRCLTVADFVFALERDGGKGMGTGDEVVRKAMARPGGPWGVAQARLP